MSVIGDIVAERQRQIDVEGFSLPHDDKHWNGEMARAAGWYALLSDGLSDPDHVDILNPLHSLHDKFTNEFSAFHWPWSLDWWKPTSTRQMLVKAAALIVAEIERLDRKEAKDGS